jgi:hypothetical protein
VYAFVEEEECSKKEKARGKNREVTRVSSSVSMRVFVVHPLRHQRGQRIQKTEDSKDKVRNDIDDPRHSMEKFPHRDF